MANSSSCCGSGQPCGQTTPAAAPPYPAALAPDAVVWRIREMDCANEENEIRHALRNVAGIADLRVQLSSRTLALRADAAALSQAEGILQRLGYPPEPLEQGAAGVPIAQHVPWARMTAACCWRRQRN